MQGEFLIIGTAIGGFLVAGLIAADEAMRKRPVARLAAVTALLLACAASAVLVVGETNGWRG
jgi:Ni/Fe-hydrogenase subunit HybB-like protein